MKISSFENGQNIDIVRDAIREALAKVEAEFGVTISTSRKAMYDSTGTNFTMKDLTVVIKEESPYMKDIPADVVVELNKHADTRGKLLHKATYQGKDFVIVGRRAAKILFKEFGQPNSPVRIWRIKMNDYSVGARSFLEAIANSKPM